MKTTLTDKLATFRPNDTGMEDWVPAEFARRLEMVANKLADALRRMPYEECGETDHSGGFYHVIGEPCPIVGKARAALEEWDSILSNVPGQVSPLTFGMTPAQAGVMTKVPKAWGLAEPARWAFIFVAVRSDQQEFLAL